MISVFLFAEKDIDLQDADLVLYKRVFCLQK